MRDERATDAARKRELHLDDLDRRNRYDREAKVYDRKRWTRPSGRYYLELENRLFREILAPLEGKRILDVAGGTGRVSRCLAGAGARVTLADFTLEMLRVAAEHRDEEGLRFSLVRGNARQLPFADGTFEAVVSTRFFHLLPVSQWRHYLDEMARVVRPGGLMLLEFDSPFYGVAAVPLLHLYHRLRTGRAAAENGWLWPHRIGSLFAGHRVLRRDGVYYPFAGRLWARLPALADLLAYPARFRPWCYLTQQVLLTIRTRGDGGARP